MQYKFYSSSEKAFSAMFEAIKEASESIYFESYIFTGDTKDTLDFIGVMAEKARTGVRVVILIDAYGSYRFSEANEKILRDSGAELIFISNILRRIHRKLLIIDHKIAFFGGVNIAKFYTKWLDLHVRAEGDNIVRPLLRAFSKAYQFAGGTDRKILSLRKLPKPKSSAEEWVIEHWPWYGGRKLRAYYEKAIGGATSSVIIVSPYFIPHLWFSRLIQQTIKRGVTVEVIIPERTDPPTITFVNLIYAARYYNSGVKFYLLPVMNHAKILVIDGKQALVGSQNIDAMSFDHNAELSVSFTHPEMIDDLENILNDWKERSTEFSHEYFRLKWYHKPLEWLTKLIQPFI